eukprot:TRINITY_DN55017_c0_g1_i1.p1 TRINITY_DN55017_c0_g1~~TRINITY_DN55017_c0_g1_i1.p1  ORF type:complete len:190 (+),score=44.16 TRINITY_DN55017_c0_g1_i1:85-654(+)
MKVAFLSLLLAFGAVAAAEEVADDEQDVEFMSLQLLQTKATVASKIEGGLAAADSMAQDVARSLSSHGLAEGLAPLLGNSSAVLAAEGLPSDAVDVQSLSLITQNIAAATTYFKHRPFFSLFGILEAIIVAGICYYLHGKAVNPTVGIGSILCAICCCPGGCLAICFPIDAGPPVGAPVKAPNAVSQHF